MKNKVDHFGISAASLESGIGALQALLGVETPRGGNHDTMGTHNCVMQAGANRFLKFWRLIQMRQHLIARAGSVWMIQRQSNVWQCACALYAGLVVLTTLKPLSQPVPLILARYCTSPVVTAPGV